MVALQNLGFPVVPTCNGPLRAGRHGNEMLNPLGFALERVDTPQVTTGDYVLWSNEHVQTGHFVSASVKPDLIQINDGGRMTDYPNFESLTSRPDMYIWWRLTPTGIPQKYVQEDMAAENEICRTKMKLLASTSLLKRHVRFRRHMMNMPRVYPGLTVEQIARVECRETQSLVHTMSSYQCGI